MIVDENVLIHYGTKRHSGRYPYGSGEDPQSAADFLSYVADLKKQGLSETEIAKGCGITTTDLRKQKSLAIAEKRASDSAMAMRLKDKGYSNVAIGERMGINESSVRSLLNPVLKERSDLTRVAADILKTNVDEKGYIDVGLGVENHIGISRTRLNTAVAMLEEEGYTTHYVKVQQLGTGKQTSIKVLAPPDTPYQEVFSNRDKISMIGQKSFDKGHTFLGLEPIQHLDSKRILVKFDEDGGTLKDGTIELRRGVKDLDMGQSRYAQVRIAVDGTHYLKGMAVYSDNMPPGVDVIFNTNKHRSDGKMKAMKELKEDPDNPFGAVIKPGGQRGVLNIVNEEGDWSKWSKNISSQVLSKQPVALAKKQLGLAYDIRKDTFDEIMALTNPVIKRKLLQEFADGCDSAAVHLKAAALPRQANAVILPFPCMKENEVYAPNYRNGERLALVRHPHGGTFEIPEVVVNNKYKLAKDTIGNARDAIGIHPKVAERLSGADFDGDTVLTIPTNGKTIKSTPALEGLKNFDPKTAYPAYPGMPKMTNQQKQRQMGDVSNLITDMTIRSATPTEIAAAVRHSMVVIDAEKHKLNYKQSYIDNGIANLKAKYQGSARAGASTLISRASSEQRLNVVREEGKLVINPITGKKQRLYSDPITGKKLYTDTVESYVNNKGKTVYKTTKSTKMYEVDDAHKLSSGTVMETVYADHANQLKQLGNTARLALDKTPKLKLNASAKETYKPEVDSLKAKLSLALENKPLERQAQILANSVVAAKRKDNPDMDGETLKKIKGQALTEARVRVGAKKQQIELTDNEWKAIQAGAISDSLLSQIIDNSNTDKIKELATPRTVKEMTPSKVSRAKALLNAGHTQADVADMLGVSTSLINSLEKGE